MIPISYPENKPKIKNESGIDFIFCFCRKKWLKLTPEEWVRQNFILFLTEVLKLPLSLIAVEKQLKISEKKKRFDLVVFEQSMQPLMLVECKEMNEPLSKEVIFQVLNYYTVMQCKYIVITNGTNTFAFEKLGDGFLPLESFDQIKKPR